MKVDFSDNKIHTKRNLSKVQSGSRAYLAKRETGEMVLCHTYTSCLAASPMADNKNGLSLQNHDVVLAFG